MTTRGGVYVRPVDSTKSTEPS
uniref:Uncharacterized protein n=1 Tax=Arundo donax TaxID=35708 RepID=A0A0A8ZFK3_ARUDO